MKRCPHCYVSVPNKAKKCEYCKNKFPKETKKVPITPKKITNSESLENPHEIKINPIPLKVKPVTPPQKIIQEPKKETIKESKIDKPNYLLSSFKISCVAILLILNIILIIKIVKEEEKEVILTLPQENQIVNHSTTEILGSWRTSKNGLFSFEDNYNFYWYEYYDDLKNNYYSGTYNFKQGLKALEEMGYTEEEFNKTFDKDIKINNVYSINLSPTYVFKANHNVTEEELRPNESWWFILMIRDDGTAIAYNKTLDSRYNLVQN